VKKNLEIQKQILTSEEYTTGWWSGVSLGEKECIFEIVICCILPVLSICRFKITAAVILL